MNDAYPRPEYPRPERRRGSIEGYDWLNLNGPWQFRFDPDRRGEERGWNAAEDLPWREQILVPFCWESLAAWGEADSAGNETYYSTRVFVNPLEVTRRNHRAAARYEVGWYRRRVVIPSDGPWLNRRVILTIGAADFFTDGWCNGRHLGRHEGGYVPFEFDLTDALITRPDGLREAMIVLRVEDPMENPEQPVGKQWRWYTTVSGIWQTVFIEPRHPAFIESFRVFTDLKHRTARLFCYSSAAGPGAWVEVAIHFQGRLVAAGPLRLAGEVGDEIFPISPLHPWTVEEPHLYDMTLRLMRGEETLDVIHTYFGMREVSSGPGVGPDAGAGLFINDHPAYLRGALYQSYHPAGVYTAPSLAVLENDITAAKRAGFNFLRVHIKIDDPLLLHCADRLGMLIMADFPNFGEGGNTPLGRRRFEEMVHDVIERDFNHPCIFAWCIFNETWGFGGQSDFINLIHPVSPADRLPTAPSTQPATPRKEKLSYLPAQVWVQKMWELAKRLDPTRLIEDMSVCHWDHLDYSGHGDTDINSWHFYTHDYEYARKHIETVVKSTYRGSTWNYIPGFHHHNQPLINSEYGGIGALDGDRDVSWSFKFLTNELRRHGLLSAYIYTEHHDVEWERNGFLNFDRTPKDFGYDPTLINAADTLPIDAPPVRQLAPGAEVVVRVDSSHFSPDPLQKVQLTWRMGGIDTLGRVHQDLVRGSVPIAFPHARVALAHQVPLRLPDQPMLCTVTFEACGQDGRRVAGNFLHLVGWSGYPAAREEFERQIVLRGAPADWSDAQWSSGASDREAAKAEDACYGTFHGFFEWALPVRADLTHASRLRVLCEASSRRPDTPQTDDDILSTTLRISLNGVPVFEAVLRNHPHDARGVLSYLRGGKGAYGYLAHAVAEGELLRRIVEAGSDGLLRFRCEVPEEAALRAGLTVYGAECGRYPICPTVIIER